MKTDHIVPVVIFLHGSPGLRFELKLRTENDTYLQFKYIACVLSELSTEAYMESSNIVARLNLVTMRHAQGERLKVYAQAPRGLMAPESNEDKRLKYQGFVDNYLPLEAHERAEFRKRYEWEIAEMRGFRQEFFEEGRQEGLLAGMQAGRVKVSSRGASKAFQKARRRSLRASSGAALGR